MSGRSTALMSAALALVVAAGPVAGAVPPALDVAFRFASAIDADPKDRARAQEQVVRDLVSLGLYEAALERAGSIDGWRGGVAFADVAEALARDGRDDEARAAVERARAIQRTVRGWQNPRIASHVARALAALGRTDETGSLISGLVQADPQQYSGQAVTTVAAAEAARGDFDAAMSRLATLDGERDVYVTWWRTLAYVGIARNDGFTRDQRLEALDAAVAASEAVVGWKRAEALAGIAEQAATLGKRRRARTLLKDAEAIVSDMAAAGLSGQRVMVGAAVARAWAAVGTPERAVDVLEAVTPAIEELLEIERPGAWGVIGAAYHVAGDEARARDAYAAAFEVTEGLVNARPRALAVVDVCRTIGRFDVPLDDADRARLERLYEGLGDPW